MTAQLSRKLNIFTTTTTTNVLTLITVIVIVTVILTTTKTFTCVAKTETIHAEETQKH